MRIIDVTHDRDTFEQWYAVYRAGGSFGHKYPTVWGFEELWNAAQFAWSRRTIQHFLGLVDGTAVVAGSIGIPMLDHREHAFIEVIVAPAERRRGHGSTMLAHLEAIAARADRTILGAEVLHHLEDQVDAVGDPGGCFARHHGYRFGLANVMRRLVLPPDWAAISRLGSQLANAHDGYELRTYLDVGPSEIAAQVAALDAIVATEAPTGGMSLEVEAVDLDADAVADQIMHAQRRTRVRTVALKGDLVVGFTDLVRAEYDGNRGYQWGTLVHRDHRGHQLGLALKIANLKGFCDRFPEADEVITFNADENSHMIAVNDVLGFVPVARLAEFEKRLR